MDEDRRRQEQHEKEQSEHRAISFWKRFVKENESCGLKLELNTRGLPINYDVAYKHAFDERCAWPFSSRSESQKFLHQIIRPDQPRLNAAHFFLASILGAQPNKTDKPTNKRPADKYFQHEGAFSRLVLTTNFDPFLQLALQMAGRLYYMSDKFSLEPDDLIENESNAIHLVYVHGNVHRKMANSDPQIDAIKKSNAEVLSSELEKRGVIIIGYNGWDDAVVKALAACKDFKHGLYWIDAAENPSRHFKPKALEILQRQGACYVSADADRFMANLNGKLVKGISRFLDNPIEQVREKLSVINLEALDKVEIAIGGESGEGMSKILSDIVGKQATIKDAKKLALMGLKIAGNTFFAQCTSSQSKSSAEQAWNVSQSETAVRLCNKGLAVSEPSFTDKANFLELRARAFMQQENWNLALPDLAAVIDELPNLPIELRVRCLQHRVDIWFEKREYQKAATDLTRIILSPCDPNRDRKASLYFARAYAWEMKNEEGDVLRAIDDYSHAMSFPYRPTPNQNQQAYYGQAVNWSKIGEHDKSIAAYTKVIESLPEEYVNEPGNSAFKELIDLVAQSLCGRGYAYCWQEKYEKALPDFERVINNLPGVLDEGIANALSCRGWMFYSQNIFPKFLQDIEAALQKQPLADYAAYHLGLALLANGKDAEALLKYKYAAQQYPDQLEEFGLKNLRDAIGDWLDSERAKPFLEILESFKQQSPSS